MSFTKAGAARKGTMRSAEGVLGPRQNDPNEQFYGTVTDSGVWMDGSPENNGGPVATRTTDLYRVKVAFLIQSMFAASSDYHTCFNGCQSPSDGLIFPVIDSRRPQDGPESGLGV